MSMHSSFSNLWLKDAVHLTYSIEGTLSQICPPFFGVPAPAIPTMTCLFINNRGS